MDQQSDEIIWNLCLKGDRKAFEILYRRYYPLLFNYGRIYSKDTELIKNCLQDFFVKLMSNHAGFSSTLSVRCYLLKAFRNALYNELKSSFIRSNFLVSCPNDVLIVKADQSFLDEEDLSPQNERVVSALRQLSSKQQEILYLYYIRELSHEEISKLLNINYQSSKNLLFRAIVKLRRLLCKSE